MIWVVLLVSVICATYWLFMSPHSQAFGYFPFRKKTRGRVIALTFDDGPNEPYTSKLLDLLATYKVHATFFCVGKNAQKYPNIVKRIDKEGHTIGNHSMSHEFHKYFTQPNFNYEIQQSQSILGEIIGKQPALFRPPWLWRQPWLFKSLKRAGMQPVSGTFGSAFEVLQPSAETIAKHALKKVKPGMILIFHDGFDAKGGIRSQTVAAIEIVLNKLINDGYKFVTVDELLGIAPYK